MHTADVAKILFLIGGVRCLSRIACRRGAPGEGQDEEERDKSWSPLRRFPQRGGSFSDRMTEPATERELMFTFASCAPWNAGRRAVEFRVEIGEYHGVGPGAAAGFPAPAVGCPTPERCFEAYHLQRSDQLSGRNSGFSRERRSVHPAARANSSKNAMS